MLKGLSLGVFALWSALGAGLVLGHYALPDNTTTLAAAHAVAGYGWLMAVPLVLWALLSREPWRIAVSVAVLAGLLSFVVPGVTGSSDGGEPVLRLATANVLMVHPDPQRVIEDLVREDPDVIVLQEVSHHWAAALERAPELAAWPHRIVYPQEGSFGVAVLSKRPADLSLEDLGGVAMARVDLEVDGRTLRLFDVHTLPPRTDEYTVAWQTQMAMLAERVAEQDVPVVLAGDLNATRYHPSYRRLKAAGLRDAHAEVGRASARTWPNGLFPLPSLRLDHVLVSEEVAVVDVWEGPANGSDHAPVYADLRWKT